jgi:hypothetical protein
MPTRYEQQSALGPFDSRGIFETRGMTIRYILDLRSLAVVLVIATVLYGAIFHESPVWGLGKAIVHWVKDQLPK